MRHGVAVLHRHLIELRVVLLIQVLKDMFQACVLEFGGKWSMLLSLTEFCTIKTTTQVFRWPHSRLCMIGTVTFQLVGLNIQSLGHMD